MFKILTVKVYGGLISLFILFWIFIITTIGIQMNIVPEIIEVISFKSHYASSLEFVYGIFIIYLLIYYIIKILIWYLYIL